MVPHKVWSLTPHADDECDPEQVGLQSLDHLWHGDPAPGVRVTDCDHHRKIVVRGKDALAIATSLVATLNAQNRPDESVQANVDRSVIRAAMQSPDMGSMARAAFFHVLCLASTDGRFDEALDQASRPQLDLLLEKSAIFSDEPKPRVTRKTAIFEWDTTWRPMTAPPKKAVYWVITVSEADRVCVSRMTYHKHLTASKAADELFGTGLTPNMKAYCMTSQKSMMRRLTKLLP